MLFFFFSSRRRHTRFDCDWSSDVCSSDLGAQRSAFKDSEMEDILINWSPQETRVAVVENGAVQELHIERTLEDRKSTRLNSSHSQISYAVFCLKKKN